MDYVSVLDQNDKCQVRVNLSRHKIYATDINNLLKSFAF